MRWGRPVATSDCAQAALPLAPFCAGSSKRWLLNAPSPLSQGCGEGMCHPAQVRAAQACTSCPAAVTPPSASSQVLAPASLTNSRCHFSSPSCDPGLPASPPRWSSAWRTLQPTSSLVPWWTTATAARSTSPSSPRGLRSRSRAPVQQPWRPGARSAPPLGPSPPHPHSRGSSQWQGTMAGPRFWRE